MAYNTPAMKIAATRRYEPNGAHTPQWLYEHARKREQERQASASKAQSRQKSERAQ